MKNDFIKNRIHKSENITESFGNKTGMPYYDNPSPDKLIFSQKVRMTPAAYIETCAEGFNINKEQGAGVSTSYDVLYTERASDKKRIEQIKDGLLQGEMDIPMLEYKYSSTDKYLFTQEGIHRAIAAKELGYKDIPVMLYVSKANDGDKSVTSAYLVKELAKQVNRLHNRKSFMHEHILEYIGEENRVQVLNQKELINFLNKYRYEYRIVFDELKNWYMIGTAFDHIHEDILYQCAPAYGFSFDGMSDYYNQNYMHLFDLLYTPKEEDLQIGFDHNDKVYTFKKFGSIYTKGPDLPKALLDDLSARYGKPKFKKVVKETIEFNDNFWKWFGKSKIVDENGLPKKVSHRTNKQFDTFDKAKISSGNLNGRGFYFSASDDKGKKNSYGKNIGYYYLRMENPVRKSDWIDRATLEKYFAPDVVEYIFNNVQSSAARDGDKVKWVMVFFNLWNYKMDFGKDLKVEEVLKRMGYDGIIDDEVEDTFVVFEPEQIKCVDNKGTWSTSSANIYESLNEEEYKYVNDNGKDYEVLILTDNDNSNKLNSFIKDYPSVRSIVNDKYYFFDSNILHEMVANKLKIPYDVENRFIISDGKIDGCYIDAFEDLLYDLEAEEVLEMAQAYRYNCKRLAKFGLYLSEEYTEKLDKICNGDIELPDDIYEKLNEQLDEFLKDD